MTHIKKSSKLDNVLYDIRGPVLDEAKRLEEEGYRVLKLNTGNPAPFGLLAPDEMIHDMMLNLSNTQGYCDSKGLFSARKAIMQYCQEKAIKDVEIEDIFIGNGVSEVIQMSMQALLDNGDEILIPSPDYPLWTASANLSGGKAVHYRCDEESEWYPDIDDIKSKITPNTKGIVVINPNNPTGALYPKELLESIIEVAREHNLIVFADEIYDKILYDDAEHTAMASLADDLLFVSFNGLSKTYRVAGFRVGWMVVSGNKAAAKDYLQGLNMLASMRLCSNVPGQSIIQTALGGYQSIKDLTRKGGRLSDQREVCCKILDQIDGITYVKPKASFYIFPKVDTAKFNIKSDEKLMYDLVRNEHILLVHGTGFNWPDPDHFRIVFLPRADELEDALNRIKKFLVNYRQDD
ncbi:pyridoxal phosphate-dependent aminotransferase [Chitinispirillales bacterium ANBcel5]|uniref:pyridoxal phosphate-dependent aminotransferase n=1 Tax=Cellulosispirillum alkaliphilum TaxID=3039283 RepID=UPI002A51C317|nr:pyridoxal phosphate-dependent aminotransferase [Chitinispirillales bacterium ANBcel5]